MDTLTATAPALTIHDSCDRCGLTTRAIFRVAVGGGTLDFCNHHYNRHAAALTEAGGVVVEDISYIFDNEGKVRDTASAV